MPGRGALIIGIHTRDATLDATRVLTGGYDARGGHVMHVFVRFGVRWVVRLCTLLCLLLAGPAYMVAFGDVQFDRNWRTVVEKPAQLAPEPEHAPEAVVQVYAARAFNWRGIFAVHTWIATKRENDDTYRLYEVTGWRRPSVRVLVGMPDRSWFGSPPVLLGELRGDPATAAIPAIESAVGAYPFRDRYVAWPGPNSNTFTAWVIRQVTELRVELPPTAIGKDYLGDRVFSTTPSDTGYQLSLGGMLGFAIARQEGLELNVLGLVLGIDPLRPALKIPGIGRIGIGETWVRAAH